MTCYAKVMYTPGCCGVRQIVDLNAHNHDDDQFICEEIESETWEELLLEAMDGEDAGIIFQVWFAAPCNYNGDRYRPDDYGAGTELRTLVRALPDVVSLGEFRNPNSGNLIDGYQWVNP